MPGIVVPAHAQPSDLTNPIPGGTEGQSLKDVLGSFRPPAPAQQGAQSAMSAGPTLGQMLPSMAPSPQPMPQAIPSAEDDPEAAPQPINRSPAAQAIADQRTNPTYEKAADSNFARIQSETPKEHMEAAHDTHDADLAETAFSIMDKNPEVLDDQPGQDKPAPAWARFWGSFPKTDEGKLSMFKKIYGSSNAKFDGTNFIYRDNDKSQWNFVSPQTFDYASLGPSVVEGVGAGLAAAPFIAGAEATMNPGIALLGTNAAIEGGAFAAASMVRSAVNFAAGVHEAEDLNLVKDFRDSAGLGIGFSVAGAGIGKLFGKMNYVLRNTLGNRQEQAAVIRGAVDEIHEQLRLPFSEEGLTEHSVGKSLKGAIDHLHDYLGDRVGIVKATAISNAEKQGINSFTVQNGLGELRKILGDKVVEDATTGELRLAVDMHPSLNEGGPANEALQGLKHSQDTQLQASQTSAWGDPQGKRVLKELVDKYNIYSAQMKVNGGMKLQDLFDAVSYFGDRSAFNQTSPLNETVLNNFKSIRNAFSGDQASAITESVKGTHLEMKWNQDFQKFTEKIDIISNLGAKFQSAESAEQISNMILTPHNADTLRKVQEIFGPKSPEMEKLRSLWVSRAIDASIDPANPVFDPKAFIREIDPKKWGKEMMEVLAPDPATITQLKRIANQANQITTSDFWKVNPDSTVHAVGVLTGIATMPVRAARDLYRMTRSNPEFANYLANNGVNLLIKGAKNEEAIANVMQGMGIYEAMVDNSTLATVARKGGKAVKVLVPASARTFAAAFKNQSLNADAKNTAAQRNMDALANQPPAEAGSVPEDQIAANPGE